MLYISLKSYNVHLLNQFCKEIFPRPYSNVKGPIFLPNKKKLYTVIRSPHVNSLSREQFEICVYRRIFLIKNNCNFFNNKIRLRNIKKFKKSLLEKVPSGISLKLSFKN